MKSRILLSHAIEGYLLDARARQLSPRTITDYEIFLRRFLEYTGDRPLSDITANDVREFLADLGGRRIKPNGVAPRPRRKLSKKTLRNHHIGLAAFWTWAVREGLVETHVVHSVIPPEPEKPAVEPLTRDDVSAMLAACENSEPYTRPGQRECAHSRPTATRDRAIILLLLDTGARASEICAEPRKGTPGLYVGDLDQRNLTVKVMGKGDKMRILRISPRTAKAIWRYIAERDAKPDDPLFESINGGALTTGGLLQLIQRLGKKAGVKNAHPHRFRHTFAVNFLRNGGNTFELQHLLGHSTLEMVKRYVQLAQVDLENAHRRASPVTNWNL